MWHSWDDYGGYWHVAWFYMSWEYRTLHVWRKSYFQHFLSIKSFVLRFVLLWFKLSYLKWKMCEIDLIL